MLLVDLACFFQVGDIIISKNKTGFFPTAVRALSECLNYYLGIQDNFTEEKVSCLSSK